MIEFIKIPLIILIIFISLSGYGILLSNFFIKNLKLNFFINPILGFILIFTILTLIHFFIPINQYVNFIIFSFGVLITFFKKFNGFKIQKELFYIFIIVLIICCVQFIGHQVNEDFGYYHLPYINNFVSDKIIIGLHNLSMVQGYNSAWLNIMSFLYLPYFKFDLIHFANAVLYFSVIMFFFKYLLENFQKKENRFTNYFAIFFTIFIIVKFSRLNSFGIDIPGFIFAGLSLFFFLSIYEMNKKNQNVILDIFFLVLCFTIMASIIKISYLPLGLLAFFVLAFVNKNNYLQGFKIVLLLSIVPFFWAIQQVLYTGCIIFPLNLTCFDNLKWYSEKVTLNAMFSLEYINKSYWSYSGTLSESEYIKKLNWFPTWFYRNINEIMENLLTFSIPIIISILIIINKKKKLLIKKYKNKYFILLPLIIGSLLWFNNAPVVRYGIFYLCSLIFVFLYFIILCNYQIVSKKIVIYLFTFSLFFNFLKNINRIVDLKDYDDYPWPQIMKIDTKKVKVNNNVYLHKPISKNIPKSDYCWDVPIYCTTNNLNEIRIERVKGYTLILKN